LFIYLSCLFLGRILGNFKAARNQVRQRMIWDIACMYVSKLWFSNNVKISDKQNKLLLSFTGASVEAAIKTIRPHNSRFFVLGLQIFCRGQIGLKYVGPSAGEQGWRSPPTNVSRVRFPTGTKSLLCSERIFSGYCGFPLYSKTSISKFQLDQDVRYFIMGLWLGWSRKHSLCLFVFTLTFTLPHTGGFFVGTNRVLAWDRVIQNTRWRLVILMTFANWLRHARGTANCPGPPHTSKRGPAGIKNRVQFGWKSLDARLRFHTYQSMPGSMMFISSV